MFNLLELLGFPKIALLIQGFDARLANRPFLVLKSLSGLSVRGPESGRLAHLASNPLVTVPILERWAKMGL